MSELSKAAEEACTYDLTVRLSRRKTRWLGKVECCGLVAEVSAPTRAELEYRAGRVASNLALEVATNDLRREWFRLKGSLGHPQVQLRLMLAAVAVAAFLWLVMRALFGVVQ